MAIKKSDLYSKLWKSCDELRGGMDASQYKDYILVLLFARYVTDKYYGKEDALIQVPEGGGFKDLVNLKGDKEIGDKINIAIRKLADANDLVGVITVADFNDSDKLGQGKEMVDRLTNLIAIFEDEELNFESNDAGGDDILGDAYEYLMRNFATQSGKSKGQFYTPAEVSRVMAKVIGINKAKSRDKTIYDPTCGSGSLLLKAADEAPVKVTIYGQEKDVATVAMAKMNMILHGNEYADIRQGDTITSPEFREPDGRLRTFHYAVANPPFSTKSWRNGLDPDNDLFNRFDGYGIPPAKNGDYAFLLHFISSLRSNGKGAIILPHGVLFRGNVEAEIRKNIIRRGYIKGIIGLPANLFYGTGIPACIIVIDKENAGARKGIFMIDASQGCVKDGNKNRLRERDIHKIVDVFNHQLELPKYARMVPLNEIEENDFNLNIPRYIDTQEEEEDLQDIAAHLLGGIPNRDLDKLQKYWQVYPSLRSVLFTNSVREGYSSLKIEQDQIKQTIFNHHEFKAYTDEIHRLFNNWREQYVPLLKGINSDTNPKAVIHEISEDILAAFADRILIDKYDIYQHLMTYWLETMKDDLYMIVENGWVANDELLPEGLLIDRYFQAEQQAIEEMELKKEEISRQKEELEEEQSGEEGPLEEVKNDKGKITKGNLQKRIREMKKEPDSAEELKILHDYLALMDSETTANREIREARKKLTEQVSKKYQELTTNEVKTLVVDDKWMAAISAEIDGELERISYRLTSRIKELAERYEKTLPQLEEEVAESEARVRTHLERMGFAW